MTRILVLLLLVTFIKMNGQISYNHIVKKLDSESIYIIGKGSYSKSRVITKKFNKQDSIISHVALGVFINGAFRIAHIVDSENQKNAFRLDGLETFINSGSNPYYISVWEMKCSSDALKEVINIVLNYEDKTVLFDYDFALNNGAFKLYCSEFCAEILNKILLEENIYQPSNIELDEISKAYLKKNYLVYYPVDFYQQQGLFKKVLEHHY